MVCCFHYALARVDEIDIESVVSWVNQPDLQWYQRRGRICAQQTLYKGRQATAEGFRQMSIWNAFKV